MNHFDPMLPPSRFLRTLLLIVVFVAINAAAGLVQPLDSSSQILIPAAASAPGVNGAFFRSDITLFNLAAHDQTIEVRWLPQAGTGEAMTKIVTVRGIGGGDNVIRSADFVHDYLGQTGLGAILITAVDSVGVPDASAKLYAATRIWTLQPGTIGTTSQSFPTIPVSAINTRGSVGIPGMGMPNTPSNYRINVGIVNLDPSNAQTFAISWVILGDKPVSVIVTVPPMSMVQGPWAPLQLTFGIDNVTPLETRSKLWTAYGSTIDNVTGDAWSELAVQVPD